MKFSLTTAGAAWLASCALITSVACGNNNSPTLPDAAQLPDARTIDAQIHADAAIAPVNVTVLDPDTGIGAATVGVIFQNPDGSMILRTTDAFGITSATVHSGASVTAVQNGGPNSSLRSLIAIEPGDSITFGAGVVSFNGTNGENVQVTIPAPAEDDTGNLAYSCSCCQTQQASSGQLTTNVGLLGGCTEATFAAATFNSDQSDFVEYLASSAQQAVTSDAQIELDGPWLASPQTDLTISNLASPIVVVDVDVAAMTGGNEIADVEQPGPLSYQSSVTISHHLPPIGEQEQTTLILNDGSGGRQSITVTSSSATTSIDASSLVLPWLDLEAPTYDSTTREISWTQTGPGSADFLMFEARYQLASGNQGVDWQVVAPPGASPIVLPQLPPSYVALDPTEAELDQGTGFSVTLVSDQPAVPYQTIRQAPIFSFKDSSIANMPWSTGTITISGGFH